MSTATRGTYRNTVQRAIILEEVEKAEGHLTAGEIYDRVKERFPSMAYGTVYRTLHLLAEHNKITELTFADQASRFDKRTDRHDHLICTGCGAIADVEVSFPHSCEQDAADQSGWQVQRHHTLFEGLCPACQAKDDA